MQAILLIVATCLLGCTANPAPDSGSRSISKDAQAKIESILLLARLPNQRGAAMDEALALASEDPLQEWFWELARDLAGDDADDLTRLQRTMRDSLELDTTSASFKVLALSTEPDLGVREASLYRMLKESPDAAPFAHTHIGELCLARGNPLAAKEFLLQATAALPRYVRAWRALARALMRSGQGTPSIDAWTRVVELAPRDPDALYQLSWALIHHGGRPRDARPYLDRALKLDPRDVAFQVGRGTVALLEEPPDRSTALTHFQEALRLSPDDEDVHYNLGILFADHYDDPAQAIEHFQRYLELSQDGGERVRQWIQELKERRRNNPARQDES